MIKGRPVKAFKNLVPSLRDFWESTRVFGDKDYIVYEDERYTYAQAHKRVEEIANLLASCGVGKGDVVSIIMRNYPEWVFTFWVSPLLLPSPSSCHSSFPLKIVVLDFAKLIVETD